MCYVINGLAWADFFWVEFFLYFNLLLGKVLASGD